MSLMAALAVAAGVAVAAEQKKSIDINKADRNMAVEQPAEDADAVWIDAKDIPMEGNGFWPASGTQFVRLPPDAATNVSKTVWGLSHHTAGFCFRFTTDSDFIHLKWEMDSGFPIQKWCDIYRYAGEDLGWRFVNCQIYLNKEQEKSHRQVWMPGDSCMIYLPNYCVISRFRLGIRKGARIWAAPERKNGVTKPVVVYGTSITQGAWGSRPGMAYLNIVQRRLDVPMVNLGFSGNGNTKPDIAQYVADVDASCYVIDSQHNSGWKAFAPKERGGDGRGEAFLRYLRSRRPDTPIILCQGGCQDYGTTYPHGDYRMRKMQRMNDEIRALYEKLKEEGWQKLHLLELNETSGMPPDGDGSMDHGHPNDWGMMNLAFAYGDAIAGALGIPPMKRLPLGPHAPFEARGGNRETSLLTIGVNHLGWEPTAPKKCWVRNPPSETFAIETLTNVRWRVLREGRFSPVRGLPGVWEADLSDLTEPGDYRILCGKPYATPLWLHKAKTPYSGVASFHFPIRKGVYDLLERGILNFFLTQRCGHVKGWAGLCHQDLSPVKDADGQVVARIDARGGYHQSCDLRNWQDGLPISTYALIRYAELKKPVWDEGEIEAEIRWGLDHYLRVLSPEGYAYDTQCTPIGWGPFDYFTAPATFGAQGNFAIVLARAAAFFRTRDAAYSAKLLAAAHGVYRQMKEHPAFARPQPSPAADLPLGAQPAETCYRQQYRTSVNGLSSLGMAALELYRADGSPALADEARDWGARMLALQVKDGERAGRYLLEPGSEELGLTDWGYCRAVSGYRLPLELFRTFGGEEYRAAALRTADWLLRSVRDGKEPYQPLESCSGSTRRAVYWSECAELFGRTDLARWAQLSIDWLLGANPDSVSSVEGFGYNQYQRAVFGQFFPSTPQQTGAVGTSADGEYDLPAAAPFLWSLARLTTVPSGSEAE